MKQYKNLVQKILNEGQGKLDRTGTGTLSLFGEQLKFDLRDGFPLVTLKKTHWKSVLAELLWFIEGTCNAKGLQAQGVTIWDEWADPKTGSLGPIYGRQWNRYDQLTNLVSEIKYNPNSRRMVVSCWNMEDLHKMALPPCHYSFQVYINGNSVDMLVNIRSSDVFLGLPFNIASYAAMVRMLAAVTSNTPGTLTMNLGDSHIYRNHLPQVEEMLSREPKPMPFLWLEDRCYSEYKNLDEFKFEDFDLLNYDPHPAIKGDVSV